MGLLAALAAGGLANLGCAPGVAAQENPAEPGSVPADRAEVPEALEAAVREVAELELQVLEGVPDTATARALEEAVVEARAELERLLDRHVMAGDDGPAVLASLRQRYPGAMILDRYAADLALRDGRPADAADRYRRLLALRPDDAAIHRGLARAYEALGRTGRAWAAYRRAFDLDPGSEAAFRGLVRLAPDTAGLEAVLRQVRRLRELAGDGELLEREVELLHRLGRPAEARRVLEAADSASARQPQDGERGPEHGPERLPERGSEPAKDAAPAGGSA